MPDPKIPILPWAGGEGELITSSGQSFFEHLVCSLSRAFHADVVFLADIGGETWKQLHSLAVCEGGVLGGSFEVPLHQDFQHLKIEDRGFLQAGQALWQSSPFVGRAMEDWVVLVFQDSLQRRLGALALGYTRSYPEKAMLLTALEQIKPRISNELERLIAKREKLHILEAASSLGNEDYLQNIVRLAALSLRVRWAMVAELLPPTYEQARTLVYWKGDGFEPEPIVYDLAGTPCEDVFLDGVCLVHHGVQQAYPDDQWLQDIGAESYMGIPFLDRERRAFAHFVIMHDAPIAEGLFEQALFQIFAALLGAELLRERAEQEQLDIERKLLETQRHESLGMLAGGIAHDFNNLLVGISGNIELASQLLGSDSGASTFLEYADVTTQRAASLANQLLAYSGKAAFETGPLNLSTVVNETRQLLQVSIPSTATVHFELASDLPDILGDVNQLHQLAMNLVLNAIDALEGETGHIFVRTGSYRAQDMPVLNDLDSLDPSLAYVFFEVKDTGVGMSEDTSKRIFEPFFTTKDSGHGLGLAAVRGIVRQHGGQLSVVSEPGEGSTFTLWLPSIKESPSSTHEAAAQSDEQSFDGLTALVIDDDLVVRRVTSMMLKRLGFSVEGAASGMDAMMFMNTIPSPPDVVFLDLTMPGMGGEEVFDRLRSMHSTLAVVFMSGYNESELRDELRQQKRVAYLQKPFKAQDLIDVILAVLADS